MNAAMRLGLAAVITAVGLSATTYSGWDRPIRPSASPGAVSRAGAAGDGYEAALSRLAAAPASEPTGSLDADRVRLAREYRASLDRLLALHEAAATRAVTDTERKRTLLERSLISRRDLEESEAAADTARARVEETKASIAQAEALVAEAEAGPMVAALPPGEVRDTATMLGHRGKGRFGLDALARVEEFYRERFGRPLPVSARGQTPVHERLGFDHRNAVDVAVHPDSPEGRALLAYLRGEGVSFLAFRAARPGQSTGAHVHIGEPSPTVLR